MVWVENVEDIAGMVEMMGICTLASLVVAQNSHCTLVWVLDSAVVVAECMEVVVGESADKNHSTDAESNAYHADADGSHSSSDKVLVAPEINVMHMVSFFLFAISDDVSIILPARQSHLVDDRPIRRILE